MSVLPKGRILRGVAKHSGDGWKDLTKKGEVVYVYGSCLPPPYEAGQFPRVGCMGWSASVEQFDFAPATFLQRLQLIGTLWKDSR